MKYIAPLFTLFLIPMLILTACAGASQPDDEDEQTSASNADTSSESATMSPATSTETPENITDNQPGAAPIFARFEPSPVQSTANVDAPAIASDLSNVTIPPTIKLTHEQRVMIARNGFVVVPAQTREFYQLYTALSDTTPLFITSDSLLHTYHLLFDATLRHTETDFLIPMLIDLDSALLQTSLEQAEALKTTRWAEAARRNAAYFAVAIKLLDPDWTIPSEVRAMAEADIDRIRKSSGIAPSAIFPGYREGEDWSQYVPRGHYTGSEALERYFQAMMWHGRMTFRVADDMETRQAALLTLALQQTSVGDQSAEEAWAAIYEPTVFFVGRSDDLTPLEYATALEAAYGDVADVNALVDDAAFAEFQAAAARLRAPEILGMVVADSEDDAVTATQGLRLMGQRFVPDAFVFQQLIHDRVTNRGLPKALDFFAALGSERAMRHLDTSGDTTMPGYAENMATLQETFASYDETIWTQNLYWSWIYSLRPLLEPAGEGYPQFMQSDAWADKQLNTALGSWTELKRDTILYAKQAYAIARSVAPNIASEQPEGYVEPVPQVYARIQALAQMTQDGLASRRILNDADQQALTDMADSARQLQQMAEKQLRGETLSDEEYAFIRSYGDQIKTLTLNAADDSVDEKGTGTRSIDEQQAALVADVATDPTSGLVLEEATGRIFTIYVAVPLGDQLVLTQGGVFSHYEFPQPLDKRLTDEAWRDTLAANETPPLADWTSSFIVAE